MLRNSLAVFMVLWLVGCGLLPEVQDETKGWSAQRLYSAAKDAMADNNYEKAVKYYESLEARYPYGRYAQQAQLEVAYAYFKDREPASAIAACERFIKLHPNHPNVDYAYYLKGLVNFNEDLGFTGYVVTQDLSDRDPKAAREAFESFKDLATKYPESKYTPDAIKRMNYLVNALSSHESYVAQYYYRRGAHVAAVNRAQNLLKTYPNTPATEEALAVLVRSYAAMGLTDLSKDSQRVLEKTFPGSKYLKGAPVGLAKAWWQFW
ncbi:MAG: outer membrane protein assembly factor BamD [Burkholderiales bacterium]|nr:outer membrane protein assembly factor BamD [Burkholderiales bacterium]